MLTTLNVDCGNHFKIHTNIKCMPETNIICELCIKFLKNISCVREMYAGKSLDLEG